ncbi:MBL fold metallo-hydrolase [Microbacterium sp. DT81.1]|uniref:MBL fold metallo-hydrolase n=1 Tax=Microbacterium sp. DT81.1 TaxID=3393413 RepID=UPI003CF2FB20
MSTEEAAMELAPHIRRIGNDIIAVHLIVTDEGITVVDAGLAGHRKDLLGELEAVGRSLDDVKGVILTHGDSDHVGFAERLRREAGVPVYVHEADAARAKGAKPPKTGRQHMHVAPTVGFFWYSLRKGGLRTTALSEVVAMRGGEILPLPGAPRIIELPGHSPGSIAVHVPLARAVFVGDALTTRHVLTGEVAPQPAPFTDDPDAAARSLDAIADLDVDWVIPGHGAPWHGSPRALVDAIRTRS